MAVFLITNLFTICLLNHYVFVLFTICLLNLLCLLTLLFVFLIFLINFICLLNHQFIYSRWHGTWRFISYFDLFAIVLRILQLRALQDSSGFSRMTVLSTLSLSLASRFFCPLVSWETKLGTPRRGKKTWQRETRMIVFPKWCGWGGTK